MVDYDKKNKHLILKNVDLSKYDEVTIYLVKKLTSSSAALNFKSNSELNFYLQHTITIHYKFLKYYTHYEWKVIISQPP